MEKYHKFIYDEKQIRKFVNIMSPLKDDEVYFLSLSARNKYLTDEERKKYELGRTEMFARKIVKPSPRVNGDIADIYIRVLKSMQVSRGGYTSRTGVELPDKCLVVYANINPSSGMKALKYFQLEMTEALFDIHTNPEVFSKFAHLDSKLMNQFQKQKGTRTLIDIDFDIPEEGKDILVTFFKDLHKMHNIAQQKVQDKIELLYYIIKTKSGYHVLLKKDRLKFNYNLAILKANNEAQFRYGKEHIEVTVNKNAMIPCPGTIAAGHKVRFIDM